MDMEECASEYNTKIGVLFKPMGRSAALSLKLRNSVGHEAGQRSSLPIVNGRSPNSWFLTLGL